MGSAAELLSATNSVPKRLSMAKLCNGVQGCSGGNAGVATLACVYTNANSLLGKMQEFKMRFCDSDISGVVETHLTV